MSDITRWKVSGPTTRLQPDANGPWVALVDYYRVIDRLTAERDEAQGEVERVKRMFPPTTHTGLRNGPGEGSWSVFAGTVVEERDEAREEVERLNAEVKRLKEQVGALTVAVEQADEAKAHAEAAAAAEEAETDRVMVERDAAQAEVERLRANNQRMFDSSRPSDEDIWRHAFTAALQSPHFNRTKMADEVLAEYRKRWPR